MSNNRFALPMAIIAASLVVVVVLKISDRYHKQLRPASPTSLESVVSEAQPRIEDQSMYLVTVIQRGKIVARYENATNVLTFGRTINLVVAGKTVRISGTSATIVIEEQ